MVIINTDNNLVFYSLSKLSKSCREDGRVLKKLCAMKCCRVMILNSFPACGDFCRLLITFANSLDSDQARQNFGPDLDPNCSNTLMVFLKDFFEKVILKKKKKKNPQTTKKACKITQYAKS